MYLLLLAGCSNETENIELEQAETGTIVADDSLDINPDSVHSIKRQPFFGDLHVHSSYSLDSYVNFNPVDPEQAYPLCPARGSLPFGGASFATGSATGFRRRHGSRRIFWGIVTVP